MKHGLQFGLVISLLVVLFIFLKELGLIIIFLSQLVVVPLLVLLVQFGQLLIELLWLLFGVQQSLG